MPNFMTRPILRVGTVSQAVLDGTEPATRGTFADWEFEAGEQDDSDAATQHQGWPFEWLLRLYDAFTSKDKEALSDWVRPEPLLLDPRVALIHVRAPKSIVVKQPFEVLGALRPHALCRFVVNPGTENDGSIEGFVQEVRNGVDGTPNEVVVTVDTASA
jgi:hypothetical protein